MRKSFIVVCYVCLNCIISIKISAQVIELKLAPSNIAIDGNLTEWGDGFHLSDKNGSFSYLISNDHNNLYLVLKTKDTVCQGNILGSGITFAISTNNPKITQKITFPLQGKDDPSEYMDLDNEQVAMKATLTRYKRIGVQNVKSIKAEQLTTTNPYGLKVAVSNTDDGYLTYEEAIPLSLLFPEGIGGKCAYSITVNGLVREYHYLGTTEIVPAGKNKSEQLNYHISTTYHGELEIGGPTPTGDYKDNLTANIEIKGEFVKPE
jgi:hypothetical protein